MRNLFSQHTLNLKNLIMLVNSNKKNPMLNTLPMPKNVIQLLCI